MIRLRHALKTEYHRSLVTEAWLTQLAQLVETRLRSLGAFKTENGRGVVSSRFNEERFMGDLSACRNEFDLVVKVRRGRLLPLEDSLRLTVRYEPATASFHVLSEDATTTASSTLEIARQETLEEMRLKVEGCSSLDELQHLTCPWCGSPVKISFSSDGGGKVFALSCSSPGHFTKMGRFADAPTWWRDKITPDWLSGRT